MHQSSASAIVLTKAVALGLVDDGFRDKFAVAAARGRGAQARRSGVVQLRNAVMDHKLWQRPVRYFSFTSPKKCLIRRESLFTKQSLQVRYYSVCIVIGY